MNLKLNFNLDRYDVDLIQYFLSSYFILGFLFKPATMGDLGLKGWRDAFGIV